MDKSFGCKIIYFTPSSQNELIDFQTTDLHDLKTVFNSIDIYADGWLAWNTNYLQSVWTHLPFAGARWDVLVGWETLTEVFDIHSYLLVKFFLFTIT